MPLDWFRVLVTQRSQIASAQVTRYMAFTPPGLISWNRKILGFDHDIPSVVLKAIARKMLLIAASGNRFWIEDGIGLHGIEHTL